MSKLSIDQKTVLSLFSDKRADFLIPDYQRPYAWTEDQCLTLWEDIFAFAIPEGDVDQFDDNDEYFLGPIVTFRNTEGQLEIIDGQQRLTTLMLLLRAFYAKFEHMKDARSMKTRDLIASCLWKTDEFGDPDYEQLKIDSEVASDDDKGEFLEILRKGEVVPGRRSRYAENFAFFQRSIDEFVDKFPTYTPSLAMRILKNLILLPIEAESQRTALRIFSTLNDRGLPLADADIFKSQFYKYFADKGKKDEFIDRWRVLEETSSRIFDRSSSNAMDELFTRYMYYRRAKLGIRKTTTVSLRDFYERGNYELLKSEQTLADLETLLSFWVRVNDREGFSEEVIRRLFVMSHAPNSMWTYFVSVYYMHNHDENGELDDKKFLDFLSRINAFIWAYSIERPGVNALRTPIFPAMVRLVNDEPVTFEQHRFDRAGLEERMKSFRFNNGRPITRSMLVWWAFQDPDQQPFDPDVKLELEHIYAKKRADVENSLEPRSLLESLGNKAFLEKSINIRASDYRFSDKKNYYNGFTTSRGQVRPGTRNVELKKLAENHDDFKQEDIIARNEKIVSSFLDFVGEWGLLTDD